MSNKRYIELYSGNRDRELYPLPASFEVPFAPTMQLSSGKNAKDPVVMGSIYYKFIVNNGNSFYNAEGVFAAGSSPSAPVLSINQTGEAISTIANYYVGWYIIDTTIPSGDLNAISLITGYNPSTATLTLLTPLGQTGNNTYDLTGHNYALTQSDINLQYISIPTLDINQNYIANYELAYNGYYLVFESPDDSYSNECNSNIFYRTITYYDSTTQIAYFDKPLPDTYKPTTPQTFTLRKTLPNERWTLDTPSFVNSTPPVNPVIGPLIGPVITLPDLECVSKTDNFYKGKYVYFYSNSAQTYPNLFPPADVINGNGSPVSGVFFPIYGSFYINAYNASTRQLSISYDPNDQTLLPTYQELEYDATNFQSEDTSVITISNVGPVYRASLVGSNDSGAIALEPPQLFIVGRTYEISWTINGKSTSKNPYFTVTGLNNSILYYSDTIQSSGYTTVTFAIIPTSSALCFNIYTDGASNYYVQWNDFTMTLVDTINICCFSNDNFTPLSYNGSMLSINETACYEVSLLNLTLPNASLVTGSRISFYPYVYVEFSNSTSPNGASKEIIYSNNPHSNKALFMAAVPQAVQPILNTFMSLSSSGSQIIKFKPNDNLRFSVYLADGTLFQTLENDLLTPYPPQSRVQIEAFFSIRRI
jgi:hypothetical protein